MGGWLRMFEAQWDGQDFSGAKIALICGDDLVVYRRDDRNDIPFPNMLDLPGGGREGNESPVRCAFREVEEEFGIALSESHLRWWKIYPFWQNPGRLSHFFIAEIEEEQVSAIRFGDEGQNWQMMAVADFLERADAVEQLKQRLAECLANLKSKTYHPAIMNAQTRLSAKGQVVIPKDVRDALGLGVGVRLDVTMTPRGSIDLQPVAPANPFRRTTTADILKWSPYKGPAKSTGEISQLSKSAMKAMLAKQDENAGD